MTPTLDRVLAVVSGLQGATVEDDDMGSCSPGPGSEDTQEAVGSAGVLLAAGRAVQVDLGLRAATGVVHELVDQLQTRGEGHGDDMVAAGDELPAVDLEHLVRSLAAALREHQEAPEAAHADVITEQQTRIEKLERHIKYLQTKLNFGKRAA